MCSGSSSIVYFWWVSINTLGYKRERYCYRATPLPALFCLAICVLDFHYQCGREREQIQRNKKEWDWDLASNTSLVYNGVASVDLQNLQLNNYLECFSSPNGKILNLIKQLFKIAFIAYIAYACFYLISSIIRYYFIYFEYPEDSQELEICKKMYFLAVSSFCILSCT